AIFGGVGFGMGVAVSVETLRRNGMLPVGVMGPRYAPHQLFAIAIGDMIAFGVLVGAAVLQRQHPDTHKRLMLLATISLLNGAIGRLLRQYGLGGPPNLFYGTDVLVLALVVFGLVARGACIEPRFGVARWLRVKPLLFYVVAPTRPWLALADALRI